MMWAEASISLEIKLTGIFTQFAECFFFFRRKTQLFIIHHTEKQFHFKLFFKTFEMFKGKEK